MPTSEREPGLYWTDMSDAEWQAQNAPWSPAWVATLARNTECHKRALYGLGSYVGDVPHDHQTGETAHMSPAVGVNVVQASCPSLNMDFDELGEGDFRNYPWVVSGFSMARKITVVFATLGEDARALEGGTSGGYATQRLYALGGGKQSEMFGAGCDLVASVFLRVTSASTRGLIQFGFASQDEAVAVQDVATTFAVEGPGEFAPGSSGAIHYTDLGTSWKRFYIRVRDAGANIGGDVRLTLSVAQTFSEKLQVTGFAVSHGRRLYPWSASVGDLPQTPYAFGHAGWQNMPSDIPIMDWDISMTNAVELEPI